MQKKGKVVLVSQQNVFAGQGGAGTYAAGVIEALLAEGWAVTVLLLHPIGGKWGVVDLDPRRRWDVRIPFGLKLGSRLFSPLSFVYRCLWEILLRCLGTSLGQRATQPLPLDLKWTLGQIREENPVAILANYNWLAHALAQIGAGQYAPIFCLAHDVLSEKTRDFRDQGFPPSWWQMTEEQEKNVMARVDVIVAINGRDQTTFQNWFPLKRVISVSSAIAQPKLSSPPVTGNCLFVGSDYSANVDGMHWFLAEVWPLVRDEIPSATLTICGKVSEKINGNYPGVTLQGVVQDLDAYYRAADVVIAPLRVGSGLKIKVVEALSHGRPVVTTAIGAQGIESLDGRGIYLGETPVGLARQIIRLLSDAVLLVESSKLAYAAGAEFSPAQSCRPLFAELNAALGKRA